MTDNQKCVEILWKKINVSFSEFWFYAGKYNCISIYEARQRWDTNWLLLNICGKVIWHWTLSIN